MSYSIDAPAGPAAALRFSSVTSKQPSLRILTGGATAPQPRLGVRVFATSIIRMLGFALGLVILHGPAYADTGTLYARISFGAFSISVDGVPQEIVVDEDLVTVTACANTPDTCVEWSGPAPASQVAMSSSAIAQGQVNVPAEGGLFEASVQPGEPLTALAESRYAIWGSANIDRPFSYITFSIPVSLHFDWDDTIGDRWQGEASFFLSGSHGSAVMSDVADLIAGAGPGDYSATVLVSLPGYGLPPEEVRFAFSSSARIAAVGPIPEPSTWAMLCAGVAAIIGYRQRSLQTARRRTEW